MASCAVAVRTDIDLLIAENMQLPVPLISKYHKRKQADTRLLIQSTVTLKKQKLGSVTLSHY